MIRSEFYFETRGAIFVDILLVADVLFYKGREFEFLFFGFSEDLFAEFFGAGEVYCGEESVVDAEV